MAEEKKIISKKKEKEINFRDLTTCDATIQMLEKAQKDGVETAFDRAVNMKACPIGADSACCKHCAMGPCRLNAKDPYGKVGVCGATIDTIMSRNFARMVAAGCAAHTDHGMSMLDLFREVVNGNIKDYQIKDTVKLEEVARSIGIETEGREIKEIAKDLYKELERTYTQVEGEIPFAKRVPAKTLETWRKAGHRPPRGHARNHGNDAPHPHGRGPALREHHQAVQPHGPGRRLGRLHGGHRDFRHPVRHPVAGQHRGQHGRAQGRLGQHHRPRPRTEPVRVDDRIVQ